MKKEPPVVWHLTVNLHFTFASLKKCLISKFLLVYMKAEQLHALWVEKCISGILDWTENLQ